MALQVFGDRILVTPQDDEQTSAGGIVLAASSQKEYKIGVVKAIADTRYESGRHVDNEIKVGDTVYYDRLTRISEDTHLISISNVLCFERPEGDDVFDEDEDFDEESGE